MSYESSYKENVLSLQRAFGKIVPENGHVRKLVAVPFLPKVLVLAGPFSSTSTPIMPAYNIIHID